MPIIIFREIIIVFKINYLYVKIGGFSLNNKVVLLESVNMADINKKFENYIHVTKENMLTEFFTLFNLLLSSYGL